MSLQTTYDFHADCHSFVPQAFRVLIKNELMIISLHNHRHRHADCVCTTAFNQEEKMRYADGQIECYRCIYWQCRVTLRIHNEPFAVHCSVAEKCTIEHSLLQTHAHIQPHTWTRNLYYYKYRLIDPMNELLQNWTDAHVRQLLNDHWRQYNINSNV